MPAARQHVCDKEGELGEMRAKLDAQADADARIESNLEKLVTAVVNNHNQNNDQFTKISNNFVKIETILADQKKANEDAATRQEGIKKSIDHLTERVSNIEGEMESNKERFKDIKTSSEEQDKRLRKIEKWIIKVAAIIGTLLMLAELGTKMDDIKVWIFPELKKVQVEDIGE